MEVMNDSVLPTLTRELLFSIKPDMLPDGSYLSGGTALALRLGHRYSQDLDFFTVKKFEETQWEAKLKEDIGLKVITRDWQTIIGVATGVKFSLFYYDSPLIRDLDEFHGISIASNEDVAATKLDVITRRATKRDYIDIYFLAQKFGLDQLFAWYGEKFKNLSERQLMIKKALVFFDDAEGDEMPNMLTYCGWGEVKEYLINAVGKLK